MFIVVKIKELISHLSRRRHVQFFLLFVLIIISSIAEVISIGTIVPFLGVLVSPDSLYNVDYMKPFIQILEIDQPSQLILPLTIAFICAILFSNITRILLMYTTTKLSFSIGADLGINVYRRSLYQSYPTHLSRNSSELIDGIITKTGGVVGIINSTIVLITSVVLIIGVMSVLVVVNVEISLSILLGFSMIYLILAHYIKSRLSENSRCIATQSNMRIKALQEGLGGIRDTIINGNQEFYCRVFRNSDLSIRKASASTAFISQSPKYLIEAVGMILIVIFAYVMIKESNDAVSVIPTLGVFALGAQRLLPALQQIYASYSTIKGGESSFDAVLDFLKQPLPNFLNESTLGNLNFSENIHLNNVYFKYPGTENLVLNNVNLKIDKGDRVGIIGETGVGKSTLVDVIMGLLKPISGDVLIDDKPLNDSNYVLWHRNISHVPQNIYLSDNSIEENIAFGIKREKIDHQKVKDSVDSAQLTRFINKIEGGYKAIVGERGAKLSGGQRQRIGIARAFYKKSQVLILDEATSALDKETETRVMNSLKKIRKNLTVFIIAHRLTTLKECDYILRLNENGTIDVLNYRDV